MHFFHNENHIKFLKHKPEDTRTHLKAEAPCTNTKFRRENLRPNWHKIHVTVLTDLQQ